QEVSKVNVTTTPFGTFAAEFTVPHAAAIGGWTLRGKLRGEDSAYTSFDVAEYRPAEFKVDVASASPAYVRGAPARFSVQADYLFGAPMAGAAVHYSVTRA